MAIYNTSLTVNEPAKLVASENPVIFNISTETGTEEFAESYFRIDKTTSEASIITFNLVNPLYQKTFYAKNYPYQSNYFYTSIITNSTGQTITTGITTAEIANSLAECLSNDPIISKYYYVNNQGIRTYLIAKEASPKYNLSGRISIAGNPPIPNQIISLYHPSTGSSKYLGNDIYDYSLFVDIYKINGNYGGQLSDGNKITELVLPFSSSDNIHRFDLSSICRTFVSSERIDYGVGGYSIFLNHIEPFQVQYGEIYPLFEGSSIKRKWQRGESGIFYVMNSANEYTEANELTSLTGTTLSSKIYEVEFLSNSPQIKKSYRTQKESLAFIVPENIGTSLKLYGDIEFFDGTQSNNNFLMDFLTSTSNSGGTFCANSGFEILSFDDIETSTGKKIRYVDFYVLQSTVGTEKFTNNSFASSISNWTNTSPANLPAWYYSGGSANCNLGSGSTLVLSAWTFNAVDDFQNWFNVIDTSGSTSVTSGSRPNWEWSSSWGGSLKMLTVDVQEPKYLKFLNFPSGEAMTVNIQFAATFYLNTTDLEMEFSLYDSGHTQIFNEEFTNLGTFSPGEIIEITSPSVYNNISYAVISTTSTDYNAGDNIFIQNITVTLPSASTAVYTTRNLTKTGLSLLSYPHELTANATFASGTGNKLLLNLKDIDGDNVVNTITLISNDAGTFTGYTQISASNSPLVSSAEFLISGQTGVAQTVKINELSLKPVVESNEYTRRKTLEFPYTDPDSLFQVAFLSKLGVYETFSFIGVESEDIERTSKTYTVPLRPNNDGSYDEGYKTTATYNTELKRKVTVNSGLLDLNHFNWLKELIGSSDIYEIRDDDTINYLLLDSVKYTDTNQDNQFSFECTFIQTVFENSISL